MFDPNNRAGIDRRLSTLTADATPRWGRLTVNRMLAHLIDTLEVTFAERPVTVRRHWFWNSWLGRYVVIDSPLPWPKGAPTAPDFFATAPVEFTRDLERVRGYVARFANGRSQRWGVSPFLGPLTADHWGRLHHRHLDWHLTQFGR
jgi:hypothetical protein